jgi:hypothetical protein
MSGSRLTVLKRSLFIEPLLILQLDCQRSMRLCFGFLRDSQNRVVEIVEFFVVREGLCVF